MKLLKKINRGFLLLIVLIIAVSIYLIASAVTETKEKKQIVSICEEYIGKEVSYNMLPEQYRENPASMTTEELSAYIGEMKETLKSYYVDNEKSYIYLLDGLEEDLKSQHKGLDVVYNYEKEIAKFDNITFHGNSVSVEMTCNTAYSSEDSQASSQTSDYMTLQKDGGKWKVTYSSLLYPDSVSAYPVSENGVYVKGGEY